jgi:hypothetical protein
LAVAATTALGVYVWDKTFGLVLVISVAMVISTVTAGFAGTLVPIMLQRLGQDPAKSSLIIPTAVTDVVGFSLPSPSRRFLGAALIDCCKGFQLADLEWRPALAGVQNGYRLH